MSRAAQPSAEEAPATADDSVDNNTIVDDDNLSVVSDLSEDLELPSTHSNYNNNVINENVNRRGPRMLNDLGPMQSPRLRSGRRIR